MKDETRNMMYFFGFFLLMVISIIGAGIYGEMLVENKTITVTVKEKIYQPSTEVFIFGHHEAYYIISEDSAGNVYKTETDYAEYGGINRGDRFYLDVEVSKER